MRKYLLSAILLLSVCGAQALRQPMNGKFGITQVLGNPKAATRLDSVKTYGEWGGWVDSSAFYHYDAKGRMTSAEGYDGNHVMVSSIQVIYQPNGGYELKETTYGDDRQPSRVYTYKYDTNNRISQIDRYTAETKQTNVTSVTYFIKKGAKSIVCKSVNGGENSVYNYDVKGRLVSSTENGKQLVYTYDPAGRPTAVMEKVGKQLKTVSKTSYVLGKNGEAVGNVAISYIDDKADSVQTSYEYNSNGQMIRRSQGKDYVDFTYTNDGRTLMQSSVTDGNIYGAKNKVFFYADANQKPSVSGKPAYDLSRYPAGSAVAKYGKLCVKDGQLCDQSGNPVQLRGMSTHGVQWFSNIYTNPSAIESLVNNWNINVFRIAMYVQESGYATNAVKSEQEWNTYIDSVSNLCAKKGIYCIIDWHILTPGDPLCAANYSKAGEFWDYMSKKHAGEAHVLYEICNEPNGSDVSWPRVREYGRRIISEIRKNDKSSVVLVGTPVWSQDVDVASLAQIEDPDVMYTLHFYSGSHGKAFRMRGDRAMAAPYKAPIFITEFGTSDASGDNGFFRDATITWLSWAAQHNLSWCNWAFADKAESASALKSGASQGQWNTASESGMLIRSILLDPTLQTVQNDTTNKR